MGWCRTPGPPLAEGEKDGALTILQDVIDLDSAGEAIHNVRECGLLGNGNAHAFISANEAGNDLDACDRFCPAKLTLRVGWPT